MLEETIAGLHPVFEPRRNLLPRKAVAGKGSGKTGFRRESLNVRPDRPPGESYDLRRITAFRISVLSNRLTLWSARVYAREFEISVLEWRVIAPLGVLGTATASQIADMTILDKGNVSRAVNGLIGRGLIERTEHPSDRRKRILSLTRRGKKLHDMIAVRSRSRETQLFEKFSEAKREQFLALLAELDARAVTLLKATEETG